MLWEPKVRAVAVSAQGRGTGFPGLSGQAGRWGKGAQGSSRERRTWRPGHLARLQAAGHTVLVGATAAAGQAIITAVLPGAGHTDITAAAGQQMLSLADVPCEAEGPEWDLQSPPGSLRPMSCAWRQVSRSRRAASVRARAGKSR